MIIVKVNETVEIKINKPEIVYNPPVEECTPEDYSPLLDIILN